MKTKIKSLVSPLVAITIGLCIIFGCSDEKDDSLPDAKFILSLEVNPDGAGATTGAGEYQEGEQINIAATANDDWEFIEWTGNTDFIDNPYSEQPSIIMPASNISLKANFLVEYNPDIIYGNGVTDIDGNEYVTVIIGDQEWMAENFRVTRYNNGEVIPTGLTDNDWNNTREGAYAICPHEGVEAFGKLYNWYAVGDPRGLCPEGWTVPSNDDWTQLLNYIVAEGFPNQVPWDELKSAANALKSCRQINSPLEGCNTSEHPRWNSSDTHYGFDKYGFSALPANIRDTSGGFGSIGDDVLWWSSTETSPSGARSRNIYYNRSSVYNIELNKLFGLSIRCVKEVVN